MSERYEREIDEIVEKGGRDIGPRTPLSAVFRDFQARLSEGFSLRIPGVFRWASPTRLGGLGAIILVGGLLAKQPYAILGSLALLMGAYLLSIVKTGTSFEEATGYDKTWRGETVERKQLSGWRSRLRRWFGRKN